MTYTVEVTREGDAWIADVLDLPGAHTYARNLTALADAIQEVIALVTDAPDDAPRAELQYVYRGVDDTFVQAAELGEARAEVERTQKQLANEATVAAAILANDGYSVRDIAGVLQMSPGRVSQILTGPDVVVHHPDGSTTVLEVKRHNSARARVAANPTQRTRTSRV